MRITSGTTDQYIYFVAVDATDLKTRETGLSGFTVYRSRNGGTATAMTTPTISELSSSNMPGVYRLLLDEDMTIAAGNDSEEMCFHITATGMAPVTRTIELYRPKLTEGQTLTVSSSALPWNSSWDAEVQSECDDALVARGLDHLLNASVSGTDITDNSIIARLVSSSATADWDTYVNTTDSLQALRDRGDSAWALTAANVWANATRSLTDKAGFTISGTLTTLDALDTAQDSQHSTTQGLLTTIDGIVDAILVDTGTTLDGKINTIDGIVDSILTDTGTTLDTKINTVDTVVDAIKVVTDKLDTALELDSTVYRFTTNALEQAPTGGGGGLTAEDVWTYSTRALTDKAGFTISGTLTTLDALDTAQDSQHSTTQGLITTVDTVVDAILVDTGTTLDGKLDVIDGIVDSIVADTNELQTDWANGGRLDNILDARASQTSVNTIDGIVDSILVDTDTTIPGLITTVDTVVDAIKVTVDALPSASDVWSSGTRTLTAGTNIVLAKGTGITGFNDLSTAQVNAEVDTALADINLDHLVKSAVDTNFSTTVHLDSVIGHIVDNGSSATFDRTTDSLEALAIEAGGGGALTAEDIWTYGTRSLTDKAGFTISGTLTTLDALDTAQDSQHSTTQGLITTVDTVVDAIYLVVDAIALDVDSAVVQTSQIIGAVEVVDGLIDTIKVTTDKLDDTLEDDSGTYRFTANALEEGPGGSSSLTAEDVWTYSTRTLTAGTNIVLAKGTGITGFNDITAANVWANATRSLTDKAGFTISGTITTLDALDTAQDVQHAATLDAIPSTTEIWTHATRELTSGNNIVLAKGTGVTGFNDVSTAQVNAEVDTALADINLDHLVKNAVDTNFATTVHLDSVIGHIVDDGTSATYDRTTDSLEVLAIEAGGGGALTAEDVWTYGTRSLTDKAGFTISGTVTTLDSLDALQDAQHSTTRDLCNIIISTLGDPEESIAADIDNIYVPPTSVWAHLISGVSAGERLQALTLSEIADATAEHTDVASGLANITSIKATVEEDIYYAVLYFIKDSTTDEYTVQWFKNDTPVTAAIASPTIQVVKRADGTDLISETSLTQIGTTGCYKYDAITSERLTTGDSAMVVTKATIDGEVRLWRRLVGRDVTGT